MWISAHLAFDELILPVRRYDGCSAGRRALGSEDMLLLLLVCMLVGWRWIVGHGTLVVVLEWWWVLEVVAWMVLEGAVRVQSISRRRRRRSHRRLLPRLLDDHWETPWVVVVVVGQFVRDAWGLLWIVHRIGEPMYGTKQGLGTLTTSGWCLSLLWTMRKRLWCWWSVVVTLLCARWPFVRIMLTKLALSACPSSSHRVIAFRYSCTLKKCCTSHRIPRLCVPATGKDVLR